MSDVQSDAHIGYRVVLGPHEFRCQTKQQFTGMVNLCFKYSTDRRYLYEDMILGLVGGLSVSSTPPYDIRNESIKQSAICIKELYGDIYDPDEEIFFLAEEEDYT